ncbi:MAG: hypothetical protein IKF19_06720 [Bacilli bacterium]|nr:hypothetical protein [Bacilli bacterium]MBR3162405.1 hypothetical protein [Bacilli bacterium]
MKEYDNNNSIAEKKEEKQQKRNNTFNIIIGVSTLIIAILGATFAYFSATATSKENDVNVKSAYVSISYDGGTEIKASNLIPSSEKVAIRMFQKTVESVGTVDEEIAYLDQDEYTNDKTRRCIDTNGREVCYVYQFSIESEGAEGGSTEIAGGIKINENEFDNLSYIVYEVEFEKNEEGKELVDKFGNKIVRSYSLISDFNLIDGNPDHEDLDPKYSLLEKPFDNRSIDGNYLSTTYPMACLFGFSDEYETAEKDNLDRCKNLSITNKVKHTYQIMIWLEETGRNQPEQGLTFQGTVNLEVPGGTGDYIDGRITGKG